MPLRVAPHPRAARVNLSEPAWALIRLYLADRIPRTKAASVRGDLDAFQRFERWLSDASRVPAGRLDWADVTEGLARAFLARGLKRSGVRGNDFTRLRAFWKWCLVREYAAVPPVTVRTLGRIRAPGNVRGAAVRFRDPLHGPLTRDELRLITAAVSREVGEPRDRAIVMLHVELGLNPNAAARLRNADLKQYGEPPGTIYQLDVPRIKKRTAHRETKRRPVSGRLGALLSSLAIGTPDAFLLHWLDTDQPEHSIGIALRRFARAAGLISPRTRRELHLTPRRLRYTLATHMAEEGASRTHIAEVLDHSDLQSVGVYTETTGRIADAVANATDAIFAPLVGRFLGRVIDGADDPFRPAVPPVEIPAAAPHLPDTALDLGGIGLCGRDTAHEGLCSLYPPLSCYSCSQFAAFRDGPHDRVLAAIDAVTPATEATPDRRIPGQLTEVRGAVSALLIQLGRAPRTTPEVAP